MSSSGLSSSLLSIHTAKHPREISSNDDVAFERAVAAIVNKIELDMRSHGDIDENPLDLKNVEFQIQTGRILKLLDNATKKIGMAICLPMISKQWPPKDFDADQLEVLNIFDKFGENGKLDKQALLSCIKKAQGIFNELVPDLIQQVHGTAAHRFLNILHVLRGLIKRKIATTAPKELAKEKTLHKMWTDNEKTREQVKELQAQFMASEAKLQKMLDDKNVQEKNLKTNRDQLNKDNSVAIGREIYISNLLMNKASIDSKQRQNELVAEMEKVKEEYQSLLQNNLKAGKKRREEKMKQTQKLQGWLTKYDNELGNNSRLLFQLNDELDVAMRDMQKWEQKLQMQEAPYTALMAEKEDEENRIREDKLLIFTTNRAAKLIQRSWRQMMKKRKKKKGGKGRGRRR